MERDKLVVREGVHGGFPPHVDYQLTPSARGPLYAVAHTPLWTSVQE
jgi:DNA-binding HxlR family transcriptional regulator